MRLLQKRESNGKFGLLAILPARDKITRAETQSTDKHKFDY